eukprot:Hpha_TRINITY_DN13479_c1_g2::TRINITY_DN13479_c1_g2_i1::g.131007::m.131007
MGFGDMLGAAGGMLDKVESAAGIGGGDGPLDKVVAMLKEADGKVSGVVKDFAEKCNPDKLININLPKIPVSEEQLACPGLSDILAKVSAKFALFYLPLVYILVGIFIKAFASPLPSAPDYEKPSIQWLINLVPIVIHFVSALLMWLGLAHVWLEDIGGDVSELKSLTDGKKGEVKGEVNKITGKLTEGTKPVKGFVTNIKQQFKPAEDMADKISSITGQDLPTPDAFVDPVVKNIDGAGGQVSQATDAVLSQLDKFMPTQLQPTEYWFNGFASPTWQARTPVKVLFGHIPLFIILIFELAFALITHIGNGIWSNPFGGQVPSSAATRALLPFGEDPHGWALPIAFASAVLAVALTAVTLAKSPPQQRESLFGEEQPLIPPPVLREGGMNRRYLMMATMGTVGIFCAASISIVATTPAQADSMRADASFDRWAVVKTEVLVGFVPAVIVLFTNILLFWLIAFMTTFGNLINWANKAVVGGFEKEINKCLDEHLLQPVKALYDFVVKNFEKEWSKFTKDAIPALETVAKVPGL